MSLTVCIFTFYLCYAVANILKVEKKNWANLALYKNYITFVDIKSKTIKLEENICDGLKCTPHHCSINYYFTFLCIFFYNFLAGIRALLKLSFELKDQGGSSEPLPHLEQYCAPLVRWLQDPDQAVEDFLDVELPVFILCDNMAFAEGGYWVVANNKVVSRGTQFHEAFDVYFKCFHVLKLDYPSSFKRVMSFVEIFCYGVKEFSRLKIVDKMLARFRKALC